MDVSWQPTKLSQKAPVEDSLSHGYVLASIRYMQNSQHKEPRYEHAELHDQCELNADDYAARRPAAVGR